ncbi:HAD family hydrolase [Pelagicoccus enzymogenes]|uniref:HAD family hydrolase n=1 Tax=Pelagicoccus enzymogenes TaxID=2773457 RepID=UPI00280F59F7|nr:HAD family hydrolase [Pelagicoccus enzymogenes]MDQ8200134.1 HAD family hydrolase [Pelagicoccus enzymogenes]
MLAIFDIDGTLIDSQVVEGQCFAETIREFTGVSLDTLDWSQYPEATSSGIFRGCLQDHSNLTALEREFKDRFLERLRAARPQHPHEFSPLKGALEFIQTLDENDDVQVAFATGGFDTEAAFKLDCCGIDLASYPHATSSDSPQRHQIIAIATQRAERQLSETIYFGDGKWDVLATRALQIPLIGIGRNIEKLQSLGVVNTFADYSEPEKIRGAMNALLR